MFDSEDKIESIDTEERDSEMLKQSKKPVVKKKKKKKSKKFHPSSVQVDSLAATRKLFSNERSNSSSINSYKDNY